VGRLEDPHFLCWKFDSPKFHDVLARSSRSAAGVVVETPLPPFVAAEDLMTPDGWNTPGGLRLERVVDGLRVVADGESKRLVEIPLQTIAGASFRLTGTIKVETNTAPPLMIDVEQRPDLIAAVQVGDGANRDLMLEFVARSDRTVLSIRAAESGSAAWLIQDMELHAEL
jgi:hypothetical protein